MIKTYMTVFHIRKIERGEEREINGPVNAFNERRTTFMRLKLIKGGHLLCLSTKIGLKFSVANRFVFIKTLLDL